MNEQNGQYKDASELTREEVHDLQRMYITKFAVSDPWYDDHEICVNVEVVGKTNDGKVVLHFSMWWLMLHAYKILVQAEVNNEKLTEARKIIKEVYDSYHGENEEN